MTSLHHFGIKGPTGLFHVYYYICKLEFERKLNPNLEADGYAYNDEGYNFISFINFLFSFSYL